MRLPYLNEQCWAHILQFLPPKEAIQLSKADKYFQGLVGTYLSYSRIHIDFFRSSCIQSIDPLIDFEELKEILHLAGNRVKTLIFDGYENIDVLYISFDNFDYKASENIPIGDIFDIISQLCSKITDITYFDLQSDMQCINKLFYTNKELKKCFFNFDDYQHLNICHIINFDIMNTLTKMTELTLINGTLYSSNVLVRIMNKLKKLTLNEIISDGELFNRICTNAPHLDTLKYVFIENQQDMNELDHLELIPRYDFSRLSCISKLENLQVLHLVAKNFIYNDRRSLGEVISKCTKIKDLALGYFNLSNANLSMILTQLKDLQSLTLISLKDLSTLLIPKRLSKLEILNLEAVPRTIVESLTAAILEMPNLKELHIKNDEDNMVPLTVIKSIISTSIFRGQNLIISKMKTSYYNTEDIAEYFVINSNGFLRLKSGTKSTLYISILWFEDSLFDNLQEYVRLWLPSASTFLCKSTNMTANGKSLNRTYAPLVE